MAHVDISAALDQQRGCFYCASPNRIMQRRAAQVVRFVDVAAGLQRRFDPVQIPRASRAMKRARIVTECQQHANG
jgi:hypothetical protein